MAKLNTYVHVVERDKDGNQGRTGIFGPNDEVPAWAQKSITNPDVWDEGPDEPEEPRAEDNEELPAESAGGPNVSPSSGDRPPTSGAGSGRDAWAAYAASQGVEVTDDMDRGAIIAAVDSR